MCCTHLEPEVKAETRHRKINSIIGRLDTPVSVQSWYYAWFGSHYQGKKHSVVCGSGLYNTEKNQTG